jgi:hypothetical protein
MTAVRGRWVVAIPRHAASGVRRSLSRSAVIDSCLAVAIGLCVLAVHDVPYLLRQSFWLDEAWVADTLRAPVGLARSIGSTTPVGWLLLLRLVPLGGPQRLRLVPLAFAGLAAAAGYLFGRELRLSRFSTGILTGAAVLLSPAMLERDDLKDFTAEAFACLVVWVLVARIENEWRLRRLIALASVASVGLLFTDTVIFVGVAAMASLALECLITRHWRRIAELAAVSAGMLVVSLAIYVPLIRPEITHQVTAYWDGYYMPTRSAFAALSFLRAQLQILAPYMGFRALIADGVGAVAGIAALAWLRRYALAAMFPLIMVIVIVASAARRYPLGNMWTSTFWLVLIPVLMAVAVAVAGRLAHRLPGRVGRRAPLLVAAVALALWVAGVYPYIRAHPFPPEDVKAQVSYLDAHFRHGDVVIVSYAASYAFAYYYPPTPSFPAGPGPNGHVVTYPQLPWMVVLTGRRPANLEAGLAQARAKIAAEPAGSRGRIWILRSHQTITEDRTWDRILPWKQVTTIRVGPDPVLLYAPP